MSRIQINHLTRYRYAEPVTFGIHRLVIRPREGHDLQVENLSLRVAPAGTISWHRDIFGNSIALASFSEPADVLEFSSEALVLRRAHTSHRQLLEVLPVTFPVQYSKVESPVAVGYLESVYSGESRALRDWTHQTFSPKQGDDAVNVVHEMNRWIYRSIHYRRREDRGVQSPLQTLRLGSGSCRDMATLLLEVLRSLNMASRFASGYIENEAARRGQASTHAWT
ncbi:MAG TPA: transglutaminase N-terminal domain-containing protein, partial [Terrimicrobiaceae bacterium]